MRNAPNLVGMQLSDAQDSLPTSIEVTITDTVSQQGADGTVIAQDPEPGEPLAGTMELTVARRSVEVYLDSLTPISGSWSSSLDVAQLSGEAFPHAVGDYVCDYSDPDSVEYNLSKGYRRLVATGGITDDAYDSSSKTQMEIFADGRQVFSTILEYGKTTPIDVDLSGVLRLKISWQSIAGNECGGNNYFALGEATLLGLPGEVPRLTTTPTN